jgi:hypothetical protein
MSDSPKKEIRGLPEGFVEIEEQHQALTDHCERHQCPLLVASFQIE